MGDAAGPPAQEKASTAGAQATADWESSVWAMELRGNLIAAGRSSGKLEVCGAMRNILISFYLHHCCEHCDDCKMTARIELTASNVLTAVGCCGGVVTLQ